MTRDDQLKKIIDGTPELIDAELYDTVVKAVTERVPDNDLEKIAYTLGFALGGYLAMVSPEFDREAGKDGKTLLTQCADAGIDQGLASLMAYVSKGGTKGSA